MKITLHISIQTEYPKSPQTVEWIRSGKRELGYANLSKLGISVGPNYVSVVGSGAEDNLCAK